VSPILYCDICDRQVEFPELSEEDLVSGHFVMCNKCIEKEDDDDATNLQ